MMNLYLFLALTGEFLTLLAILRAKYLPPCYLVLMPTMSTFSKAFTFL